MRSLDLGLETRRIRRLRSAPLLTAVLLALNSAPLSAQQKNSAGVQLPGYEAVPVRYGFLNKMLMNARINNHSATLMIDTGAGRSVLEARRARGLGVNGVPPSSPYGEFVFLNGQRCRVGFIDSMQAGSMNFGSGPIALLEPSSSGILSVHSRIGNLDVDGVLGSDILTRYKAIINCRTRLVFFKTNPAEHLRLGAVTAAEKFVRVPMREEANRAFTVPCSINGHAGRLVVDTGASMTTFDQAVVKSLGIPLQPTRAAGRFSDGVARQISLGQFKQFMVGDFNVPPEKVGAAVLPDFAVQHGSAQVDGLFGMEMLVICHAIIDFDSMSLYLK